MAFLDHVRLCNAHDASAFRPFVAGGVAVGKVREEMGRMLGAFPAAFRWTGGGLLTAPGLNGFGDRSAAAAEAFARAADAGDLPPLRGEDYPVVRSWGEAALMKVDRTAATALGVLAFGEHVNGLVDTPAGRQMWVGRRAHDRLVAPGKLDSLVGGGQPYGLSIAENLLKECEEEAGIGPELALLARSAGAITYAMDTPHGVKRDVLFIFDLLLPADFRPANRDGEVEEFFRMSIEEAAARVRDSHDFKFNVALVIIDYLIRTGRITPHEPGYLELVRGLHGG
jgi:8-oxo-dGTP pyrophosphatase MutT (NUDIX family)